MALSPSIFVRLGYAESRIDRTSELEWPVTEAISSSVQPISAKRVTVLPRISWNVSPVIPARICAVRKLARKPDEVNGCPSSLVTICGLLRGVASNRALSGAPTRTITRLPVCGETNVSPVIGRPCEA